MVLEKRYLVEIWVRKVPCCDETAAFGRCYHRNSDREKRRFATTFPHLIFQKPRFHRGFSRAEQKKNTCFSIKTPHCPTPEAARRPLRVSGICKPLSGFLQHSKAEEKLEVCKVCMQTLQTLRILRLGTEQVRSGYGAGMEPKKGGARFTADSPGDLRSTENVYHVCRITKSYYNMEPVAM